jgi:hypothetical protein
MQMVEAKEPTIRGFHTFVQSGLTSLSQVTRERGGGLKNEEH